jgi:oligopeptidase B
MAMAALSAAGAAGAADTPAKEPVAEQRPTRLEKHGDVRVDPWYWLREREDAEVRAYLEAENAYLESTLAPSAALRRQVYAELVAQVAPEETTAPRREGGAF